MGFVNNLSRSEALHLTLQEYGVIDVLQGVLEHTSVEVNRTQALITVAHVYAGQEMHAQSDALLSRYDASLSVMTMLDACLHGDSMFGGACWALEEVVQAVQSLSQKPQHAEKLWKVGCIELLIEVLTKRAEDMDAAFQACRTIANMAGVSSLKGRMQQKKEIVKAAQAHEASEDLRVQDAAKGALLQLGALKDESVLAANSALTGDNRDYSQKYDVFLSHKRTDSKDFARALYNLLVVRSFKTFLDYEYREELSDLGQIVANSANLIFIMTDNIFDSPWCIRELEAAVASKTNIILLVKEGSRWKNEEGLKICEFPGGHILGKLSDDTRKVFTRKALYHSDEYYQTFVDMLVKKIVRWPSEAAAAAAGVASLGAVEGSSAVPGGGGGGGGGAGGASSGAAAVAPWLTPIWPQPQSSDPMMATAMAAAAAARQSIFTGGAGLMPAAPFGGGGGGFMHSPGTGAAELMSLMSGELWGLRRDVLSGLQDVRREHASELHQFKLDVSQQLQQLHRSSQQTQTAVSDLQHRLGELLQLVPSISSSAAAAAARAAATAVAASENGSSSATGVGGGGGSYCLGSEPSAGGCGAVIHAPAALSDLQMAAMQRQVEAIAAGLQHVSVQVQQQQQQQRRTTAFMASSAAGAGGGPWAAPHEDLLQNPLMSVLPPGINTAAFPAQEGSSSGANTSHVASPAPSNASFGSGSASGALTGGQFNGSGGRNGVAVSGGGFVRSTRGQQGHGLHGCLPQISGKQQR
ncbi:hypothetical protein HXX76_008083 [Chlamydomonas incerta]|uniref:TIR domain-containing protein n=1 Tax=Chlamydomonas incerta TaxID=51695 RepID=A0A835T8W1_CHLIN|nr:hypothetical protein HXX76_008083 [Chlamydomonas incerta]|eukprot:KAG2433716.1 hypothetical protein HXX76_008083 [Chlamydomonas incerta]